ncbi:MAG TPA: glycosyltransferase family 9 protein [Leptolyngbyaceae cyanobacterium M65_K2018_010]|nr:glycosyltransferase family 9 protein [Leptolyngbyaceae cyanobacterium M65_K2018_010]
MLSQIKDALETAEIAVVVDPGAKEIYQLSKAVTEVVPYSFQASNSPADWANLLGILRDREYEAVLTLTDSWSIGLLLWLSGIPTRVGFGGGANGLFLTDTVPRKANQPLAQQYGDLLQAIHLPSQLARPSINVPQSDLAAVEALRQTANLRDGYVLIYPSSTATGDSYPVASWVQILQDFQQRQPTLPVVLVKTPATAAALAPIQASLPHLTVLEPETMGQLAALLAGANLLIGVQGYPLTLAAALGVYALELSPAASDLPLLEQDRRVQVTSSTGKLADIAPDAVLKKVWSE